MRRKNHIIWSPKKKKFQRIEKRNRQWSILCQEEVVCAAHLLWEQCDQSGSFTRAAWRKREAVNTHKGGPVMLILLPAGPRWTRSLNSRLAGTGGAFLAVKRRLGATTASQSGVTTVAHILRCLTSTTKNNNNNKKTREGYLLLEVREACSWSRVASAFEPGRSHDVKGQDRTANRCIMFSP